MKGATSFDIDDPVDFVTHGIPLYLNGSILDDSTVGRLRYLAHRRARFCERAERILDEAAYMGGVKRRLSENESRT